MSDVSDEVRERVQADPFCRTLGIEVTALTPDSARAELTVSEDLLNFHGTPHGGAIYSLADAAFAAASNARGETAVALETNISYLDAVEPGTTLEAIATETHLGGRTAEYAVEVRSPADDRIATFRGRVYRPD
jgi:acyl-CoA thioesterase